MDSLAIYDFACGVIRGIPASERLRERAFAAPVELWQRILGFDGCTVQFARALDRAGWGEHCPLPLRRLLRESTATSLQRAVLVHQQLAGVAALAGSSGVRVMAIKGAARLLAGELPGTRSLGDIDLLAAPADAARLHELLQRELGYRSDGQAYPHHLAGLTRPGSLGIEIHVRLAPVRLPLDLDIWRDAGAVRLGGCPVDVPSPTGMFLHTLEHAVRVNWTSRYRLRDIVDLAVLFTGDVDPGRVRGHVLASDCRSPMETVLGAARELEPLIPLGRRDAWRTVERVGRARLAMASRPRTPRVAARCFRYAGLLAECSPRTLAMAGRDLVRRLAGGLAMLALGVATMASASSCDGAVAPRPFVVPSFVFAANDGGVWSLQRFSGGAVTRLSSPGTDDREPHSAAGRVVFTSLRDGNAEIYEAPLNPDLTLGTQRRLTVEFATDGEPALSPSGATIAFVSARDGSPRIWLMDGMGGNQHPLATGSATYIPEGAPRWSPTGDRIAFTSSRTGQSQVYVIAATGGTAAQLSHETRGAYTPTWLPDGQRVVFMTPGGVPRLLAVPAAGGDAVVLASDTTGLAEPSCGAAACLAVADPSGGAGRIVALTLDGRRISLSLPRVADDHHPALIDR